MESIIANPKLLVTLLFSFIGLILSIIGILNYLKAKNSITWPTAVGTILTSDVKKETSSSSNNGTVTTYKPEICYSYKVEGIEYISNRIRPLFNYSSSSSTKAFTLTRKYPVNSQITIYYNPKKPKVSVIEPGLKADNIVFLLFGPAILVASLIFAYSFGLKEIIFH
jgi:hypothetical protein